SGHLSPPPRVSDGDQRQALVQISRLLLTRKQCRQVRHHHRLHFSTQRGEEPGIVRAFACEVLVVSLDGGREAAERLARFSRTPLGHRQKQITSRPGWLRS